MTFACLYHLRHQEMHICGLGEDASTGLAQYCIFTAMIPAGWILTLIIADWFDLYDTLVYNHGTARVCCRSDKLVVLNRYVFWVKFCYALSKPFDRSVWFHRAQRDFSPHWLTLQHLREGLRWPLLMDWHLDKDAITDLHLKVNVHLQTQTHTLFSAACNIECIPGVHYRGGAVSADLLQVDRWEEGKKMLHQQRCSAAKFILYLQDNWIRKTM